MPDRSRVRGKPINCNELGSKVRELEDMLDLERQLPQDPEAKTPLEITGKPIAIASTFSDVATVLGDAIQEQSELRGHGTMRSLVDEAEAALAMVDLLGPTYEEIRLQQLAASA